MSATMLLFAITILVIGIPLLFKRLSGITPHQLNAVSFSLALMSALGAFGYFGLTEMAGRHGMAGLLAIIAFSIVFLFAPLVLRPIQWATNTKRLPTLAGLFSYRYRGTQIGPLVGTVVFWASLPFSAGQLRIAGETLLFNLNSDINSSPNLSILWFSLPLGAALWLFGGRSGSNTSRAMLPILATCGAVALVSLLISSLAAVNISFGSLAAMQQWVSLNGQDQAIHRFDEGYSLMSLLLIASLVMPQLYHLQAQLNPTPRQWSKSGWLFPLLLFIASLTMFPVLWSGLNAELEVPLEYYLLAINQQHSSDWIGFTAQLGGLASCAAATILSAMTISQLADHNSTLALQKKAEQNNFYRWQRRRRRMASLIWLGLSAIAACALQSNSISHLTLITFVGVAQLIPGLLSALYVPALNRTGVTAGLVAGFTLWAVGLLIPLFIGEWYLRAGDFNLYFGASSWSNWLLISLAINFLIGLLVSRIVPRSSEEAYYVSASMVDEFTIPHRIDPDACDIKQVETKLLLVFGSQAASNELQRARAGLPEDASDMRPFEWRELRDRLTVNLYQLIGVLSTEQLINKVLPLTTTTSQRHRNLLSLERLVSGRQHELFGAAAEVNKLRIHQQQILQNLPVGACSLDNDGEITLWNQTMAELTQTPASTAIGGYLKQLPDPWRNTLLTTAVNQLPHQYGVEIATDNQSRWFNIHKAVVADDSELDREQVILLEEVTDTILLTQSIGHTERLASVGRFAAGVAHEIGNPVTGIACLAQDIKAESNHPESSDYAQQILDLTKRITRIVQTMVDFSRSGEEGKLELQPVQLLTPIEQALQLFTLNPEANDIEFEVDINSSLTVRGEPHQLVQVFLNLITNARDASEPGGKVTISANIDGQNVLTRITDSGSGIPADKLDKVFEPFFTTKEVGEGTGLGLWLVYSMIRNMGGNIELNSPIHDNRGTSVTILLPLVLDIPAIDSNT